MIVIRTTARPRGADYLPGLLGQLDADGFAGVLLTDGAQARTWPGWRSVATGEVLGSRRCGWRALELAAVAGEDLVLLEDDVVPQPGALAAMVGHRVQAEAGFASFFDSRRPPGAPWPCRRLELLLPAGRFLYSQATKIPLRTAAILAVRDPGEFRREGFDPRHAFDRTLGQLAAEHVSPFYSLIVPNLVEHRGDDSVVFPARIYPIRSGCLEGA